MLMGGELIRSSDESCHLRRRLSLVMAGLLIANLAGSTAPSHSISPTVSQVEASLLPSLDPSPTPVELTPTVVATTEAPEIVSLPSIEPSSMHTLFVAPPEASVSVPQTNSADSEQPNSGEITTCAEALAYLKENANPAYKQECGYAWGGQAATCNDHAPECPGEKIIRIKDICNVSVKNEAANSWLPKEKLYIGSPFIDPYGSRCN